jgi:hypothetical protein
MLDVHPARHAANTWKDFFVHIATIVIGLLIAVCLEQTVEYFHHRHQRNELIESLKSDTKILVEDAGLCVQAQRDLEGWYLDRERRINDALVSGRPATDLPGPPVVVVYSVPSYTHFEAGKASGLLQLLSTEDMDAYSDVSLDVANVGTEEINTSEARKKVRAFEAAFSDRDFRYMDLSKASATDLREYLRLLDEARRTSIGLRKRAAETLGAAGAVLSGERGIRKLEQAEDAAVARDRGSRAESGPSSATAPSVTQH